MSLSIAEILLSTAEIAHEPNDGHLEIFTKVINVNCCTYIKDSFKMLSSADLLLSPAEIAYEPNDGHLEIFKKFIKVS